MLSQQLDLLSPQDVRAVHDASMAILGSTGVAFFDDAALSCFRRHGTAVQGRTVFLREQDVLDAVALAPPTLTLHARDPEKTVIIGGGRPCLAPGYGAPFIIDGQGRRPATMADYDDIVRLVDALPNQDLSGFHLVHPHDVPHELVHLDMLYSNMANSSKPFMGSVNGYLGAHQTMEMAAILFGDVVSPLSGHCVTMALINTTSPLQYGSEAVGALVEYARWGQPLLISALTMAGATGPVTLAGVLAQQNAEVLAGVTLAQLMRPGTPVVYGSFSTMMDMRSGMLSLGGPETALLSLATAQVARAYGLPHRGGSAATDVHVADYQAGAESMLGLMTAVAAGTDFVLHAGGMLSSCLAFSTEKLVVDDDLCGLARRVRAGVTVSDDTLAVDVIDHVGNGGNFLEEDHTLNHCRTAFWQPDLCQRRQYEQWCDGSHATVVDLARVRRDEILADHQPQLLDPTTAHRLERYIAQQSTALRAGRLVPH